MHSLIHRHHLLHPTICNSYIRFYKTLPPLHWIPTSWNLKYYTQFLCNKLRTIIYATRNLLCSERTWMNDGNMQKTAPLSLYWWHQRRMQALHTWWSKKERKNGRSEWKGKDNLNSLELTFGGLEVDERAHTTVATVRMFMVFMDRLTGNRRAFNHYKSWSYWKPQL